MIAIMHQHLHAKIHLGGEVMSVLATIARSIETAHSSRHVCYLEQGCWLAAYVVCTL